MATVVQARMSSSRFPGKVLQDLGGVPAIELLLRRLKRAHEPDALALATSSEPSDDILAALVKGLGVTVVRGPLEDVLARYELAVDTLACDAVVRITGDCPLIDPDVVDRVVVRWREGQEDYVANVIAPRTFPIGMDTEVISTQALRRAAAGARDAADREHVTTFVRNRPELFSQARVDAPAAFGHVRLVLDTPADLDSLRRVVAAAGPSASMESILRAMRQGSSKLSVE